MPPNSFDFDTDNYNVYSTINKSPSGDLVHEAFQNIVALMGERDLRNAVIDGDASITFGELEQRSTRLAKTIVAATHDKLPEEAPVGICLEGSAR